MAEEPEQIRTLAEGLADMATQIHSVIEDMQKHHSHMVIPTAYIPVLDDVHGRLRGVVMMLELEQKGGGDGK